MYAIKKIQMDFFFFFFFIFYQRHIYILVNILLLIWWTILSFVVSFYRFNVILWKRMEIEEMRVSVYYMRVMRWKSPESYLKIRLRAILSTYDPIILMTSYWQASFDGFRWQIYKQKKTKTHNICNVRRKNIKISKRHVKGIHFPILLALILSA